MSLIPGKGRDFFFFATSSRPAGEPTKPPIQLRLCALSSEMTVLI